MVAVSVTVSVMMSITNSVVIVNGVAVATVVSG